MNKFSSILMAFLILSGISYFSGCVKGDFETPPVVVPDPGFEANTTIPQLIAMHSPGGLEDITTDIIIKGVVVANDESGNFYKQLIIEDDSLGLQIQIDQKDLYTTYKLGQTILVKCNGLALGEYFGCLQLGYNNGTEITRIPSSIVADHIFLDSLPGAIPEPKLITIPTVSSSRLNMLVKLEGIHFTEPGQVFSSTTSSTNHNMMDAASNILILRTSNYASFASSLIPSGTGSVTGVLGIYDLDGTITSTDYQLYIRDLGDLEDFSK